jgi:trehalose/maltose hydrolase-like predicted phosphorylase
MAVWVLEHAFRIIDILNEDRKCELLERLGIDKEEITRWEKITQRIFVPIIDDNIIDQFEGFNRLNRAVSWNHFRKALMSDISDIQGGTTPEGIHLGAMAGTVERLLFPSHVALF